jgi:hypothetical protein
VSASGFFSHFSPLACTPDGKIIVTVGSSKLTVFHNGQAQAIAEPDGYSIKDIQISNDARRIAAFLSGKVDAAGILDLSAKQWSIVVKLQETMGDKEDISGLIRFLDDNRIIAASTRGWTRIIDIATQSVTPLSDKRRGVDKIAVNRETGNFVVARRSGSVTIYDKTGFPIARLLSTASSDGLNPNFDVVSFDANGKRLLTAARNGVRLWYRPEYALIVAREGPLNGDMREPPGIFKETFGSVTPGRHSDIEPCSMSQNMVIDDAGLLSLCVRFHGRDELLPTGLSIDEFKPIAFTEISKDLDFARWEGDDHTRIFVLNAYRIANYVRSQPIWSPDLSALSLVTK